MSIDFRFRLREFIRAMRLFSLGLAVGATTLGMLAAYRDGSMGRPGDGSNLLLIILIMVAGTASQLGANLINDYFEGSFKYADPSSSTLRFLGRDRTIFDILVFLAGLASLATAALIGIYLVWLTDWVMLVIGLAGLLGSYAYTGEPFVYKTKGLGVILSFVLMGPLMLLGAYYPFAQRLDWYPVLLGLPVSLLVPALMISNEIRDFHRDKGLSVGTLTNRVGSWVSLRLYEVLVFGALILIPVYVAVHLYPSRALLALVIFPVALKARSCVSRHESLGISWTSRVHMGLFVILATVLATG